MTVLSKLEPKSSVDHHHHYAPSQSLFRRLLGHEWSFGYNCYEVGHTWTPNCTDAALDISTVAATRVAPLYAALYAFSQLAVQRKYTWPATVDTLESIIRSTSFIFFHAYNGSAMACALRHTFGRFYYRVLICLPALMSCYLSLLIEKPSRRQALAFYMLNLASEVVYRMMVTKGYFKPLPNGETLVFSLSLAAWFHFIKQHGFGRDPVSSVAKLLLGRDEAAKSQRSVKRDEEHLNKQVDLNNEEQQGLVELNSSSRSKVIVTLANGQRHVEIEATIEAEIDELLRQRRQTISEMPISDNVELEEMMIKRQAHTPLARAKSFFMGYDRTKASPSPTNDATSTTKLLATNLNRLSPTLSKFYLKIMDFFLDKHSTCPHKEHSCALYATNRLLSRFALGYSIQVGLKLVTKPHLLLANPKDTLKSTLISSQSFKFGMFLASLVSYGRLTSCSLRRISNSNSIKWHAPVAGFVSGLSMLWAPKSSISMYIMWKAVEQYYLQAAKQGHVKHVNFTIMTIYAASAATILYTFALEPRFIRPSYMKFLDTISDHRLHQLNRLVLDVFGTGSSVGYEDYFPDLDPKYMSNEFQELIFNWLIQPY